MRIEAYNVNEYVMILGMLEHFWRSKNMPNLEQFVDTQIGRLYRPKNDNNE